MGDKNYDKHFESIQEQFKYLRTEMNDFKVIMSYFNDEMGYFKHEMSYFRAEINAMNRRFDKLEEKLDTKADADKVYSLLDQIIKQGERRDQEHTVLAHQVDCHTDWINQASKKLKIKFLAQG